MNTAEKDPGLLTALEVCLLAHCSYNALNYWYRWRAQNPDNEYAKLLPDYIQYSERQARYWKREDVAKIIQFRETVPQGRNGIMGDVTQKYRRAKRKKDRKKKGNKKNGKNGNRGRRNSKNSG